MKYKIGLNELADSLAHTHLKLNLDFLDNLLKDASKSDKPYRNLDFINLIGCYLNSVKNSSPTIFGWIKGYRTMPMNKLLIFMNHSNYSWKDIEENLISIKAGIRRGEIKPKLPILFDEKLGSIVGHLLGDGSIDKRDHSLFYSNSDIHLLKEFNNNINLIFGISPRIWVQKRRKFEEKSEWLKRVYDLKDVPEKHCVGLFCPKICCDILYAICGKFAEGKVKKITNEIINAPKEFKIGLIRAFFDDECSVDYKNYMIRLHQDKKEILLGIKTILCEFNIKSQIIRSYVKRDKSRYYFNITGFKEYYKFFNIFGCTSPDKKRKFNLLINKVKKSKRYKNIQLS